MFKTIIMNKFVLYFIILIVGHHGSSVLCILETETLQLDLRNSLDMITKDLITRGLVEDNTYNSYVFHSGIGNREELKVTSFSRNDAFLIDGGVEKWQTLASGGNIYILGQTQKDIILTIASQKHSTNRSINVTTQAIDLPPNTVATASTIFERWNQNNKTMDVIIVIAIDSFTSDLLWYRLNNKKIENFWSWSRYKPVSSMVVFTIGNTLHLITINMAEKNHSTTADVYDIALQKLDFRLSHSLLLDESCSSIEIGVIGKDTYLFIPQTNLGILLVFKYDLSGGSGYFQPNINITSAKVTRAHSFTTASQHYIAVNGKSSSIYRIKYGGVFVKELNTYLDGVDDWVIIPVHTYRSEVVILANHNEEVKLLVWKGVGQGFDEGILPDCYPAEGNTSSCLIGRFSGAVAIPFHDSTSILLPTNANYSALYHVITSLNEVKNPVGAEILHLNERTIFLQDIWNRQKKVGEDIKDQLIHTIKPNDTNIITAKWIVELLETPVLTESGRVTHSRTYSSQSNSVSQDTDLLSLKGKIDSVNDEINLLKNSVYNIANSKWDLRDFNGKVVVKGGVFIQNLTLFDLNGRGVNRILHDSLRWDKPKKISGSKIVPQIKTNHVMFNKINNFTSTQLSYVDGPVTLSGDVTFLEKLIVQDSVNLPKEGLVNGIDFSEEVCQLNESCPVALKFENLIVQNSITAEKINDKPLDIHNSEEPSEWSSVFAGKSLTVDNINGKNWTDIVNRVVYTDRDAYIPESTIVNGNISSDNDIELGNLIELSKTSSYDPEFRRAENETVNNQAIRFQFKNRSLIKADESSSGQEPSNNSAATVRNQKVETPTFLKATLIDADVIFTNVEVLREVSSDETLNSSSWADDIADVILINETEAVVSGIKTFNNTLDIRKDFQINGLVGGVNLSQVMTIDTDQILNGVRTFHGNITFSNMVVSGDWDGINVTTLDMEAVRLSVDQILPSLQLMFNETLVNIEAENLILTDTVNNVSVHDIITDRDISEGVQFSSLSAKNLTILGSVDMAGKMCGWNLTQLDQQRFSLTQDQNVTGNFTFNEMNITDVFDIQQVNEFNISTLTSVLNEFVSNYNYSDMIISELHVIGNINTSKGVAGYDLNAIAKDAILLTGNNNIKTELVFEDLLTCEMLDVHDTVGGHNWTWFTQNVVYKNEIPVVLEGKKTFESGFHVTKELEVEEINSRKIKDILTTSTEQNVTGEVRILGDLTVNNEAHLLGTLNEKNISELASRCSISEGTDSIVCTGDVNFECDIHVNNLIVKELMNLINFNKHVSSILFKNNTSTVSSTKTFTGDVTFTDLSVFNLNGQEFDKFLEDIVLMEPEAEVTQHITFIEDVSVLGSLVVGYNLDVPTIHSYNFTEWADNAVYLDRNMSVTGLINFKSASSEGDITTHYFGDLNMYDGSIILLKSPQTLSGTLRFEKLTSLGDVPVGYRVNNARLDQLHKNTLMIDWDQVVESEIVFTEDIVIEGNLTTLDNVNEKDLKKILTLHTNQTLSGNYVFDCLSITNVANTSNVVSGINFTDWKEKAVMLDTDQEIFGTWNIEDSVHFMHPVKGLVNLGNVTLQEMADEIKTYMSDRELEMQENLTSLCNNTNALIKKSRRQNMSLLYFEAAQKIEITPGPFKPHYFQAHGENYLFVSQANCSCLLYKWNETTLQFTFVYQENLSYFTRWVLLQHDKQSYAISLSEESSTCQYRGVNLWTFSNDSLQHIMQHQIKAKDITGGSDLQNVFYSVDTTTAKQWSLGDNGEGKLSVFQGQGWIINITGDVRFLDSRAGLGLVVSNGSYTNALLPSNTLPHNFIHHFNDEVSSNGHGFLAVAMWEDCEVQRRSDFVKIYKLNGRLYDKLLTDRPSQLNWFSLQDTTWLAFIEDSITLQVYQHQDVFRGFQQKFSINLQSSGLMVTSLPIQGKWNKSVYLFLSSNTSIQLIATKLLGDPYTGPNLHCYFKESLNWASR